MSEPATPREPAAGATRATHQVVSASDLGRLIRARREFLGHTQADAAALCGVGVRFLSELERGKATIELGRALRVAQRLGLEVRLSAREGKRFWNGAS